MQQITMRRMQFDAVDTEPNRSCGCVGKGPAYPFKPRFIERNRPSSATGEVSPSFCGTAEGATVCQPPCSAPRSWPPFQGTSLDALRPACPSCNMNGTRECSRAVSSARFSAASVLSSQRPRSPGVMRPAGSTAVASTITMPAPDKAMLDKWTACHELASPSVATYWHIGDTTIRFGIVSSRSLRGRKSVLIGTFK